jgi:hypothetical protein
MSSGPSKETIELYKKKKDLDYEIYKIRLQGYVDGYATQTPKKSVSELVKLMESHNEADIKGWAKISRNRMYIDKIGLVYNKIELLQQNPAYEEIIRKTEEFQKEAEIKYNKNNGSKDYLVNQHNYVNEKLNEYFQYTPASNNAMVSRSAVINELKFLPGGEGYKELAAASPLAKPYIPPPGSVLNSSQLWHKNSGFLPRYLPPPPQGFGYSARANSTTGRGPELRPLPLGPKPLPPGSSSSAPQQGGPRRRILRKKIVPLISSVGASGGMKKTQKKLKKRRTNRSKRIHKFRT